MTDKLNESLKMKKIFMNEFTKRFLGYYQLTLYDMKVDWTGTYDILKESWQAASKLTWNTDNFQNIKSYYIKRFDFLKIIFFRLTWKHLLYIEVLEQVTPKYSKYAQQWHKLLNKFGKMLRIENDPHIVYLLKAFDMLINRTTSVDYVKDNLTKILHISAQSLKVNATTKIELSKTILDIFLQDALSTQDKLVRITPMITANNFIRHLKSIFRGVDFGVIRSLLDYIDEVMVEIQRS